MLFAVATFLDCRSPAFFECTVTMSTVRMAGHILGVDHLIWAAENTAWTWTAAVFIAEILASRGGGAARHRARPLPASAVFVAMQIFRRF